MTLTPNKRLVVASSLNIILRHFFPSAELEVCRSALQSLVSRTAVIVAEKKGAEFSWNTLKRTYLLTTMSSPNINPRLVFLSFSFSIASGLCFLNSGHTLLQSFGVPGFTTLPPYTSGKIGLVGGVFTALPVLAMRSIPSDLSRSLECPYVVVFFIAIIAIGAAQGYVGARMWKGKIYTVIGGQRLPAVLGVGRASLAGAVGALSLVVMTLSFMAISTLIISYIYPKDRFQRERARRLGPVPPEFEEMVQNEPYLHPLPIRRKIHSCLSSSRPE